MKVRQTDFHNVSSFSVTFIIVLFRGSTIRVTVVLQHCLVEQSSCTMTSTSTPEDSLQSHVKGLEFLKEIGKGSYGIVYRAKWNGEEVAAKRFHPILFENGFCQESMRDFQREREVLEATDHPNIVKLKTVLLPEGVPPIIITELLHCDLEKYIRVSKTSPKVSENNLIQIATDVSKGLEYMHGLDPPIVHRDLATKNILLTVNGNAKIADFGVSKAFSAGRDMNASIVPGTPDYAAPETYPAMNQFQMTGEPMYGPKVDVFSFGAVLLCMIVGHEPRVKPPCPITKGNYPLLRVYQLIFTGKENSPLKFRIINEQMNRISNVRMIVVIVLKDML